MRSVPDPRTIRRALGVLERLPLEALADLTERLIDRMDAAEALDLDLEEDFDSCPAEDIPIPGHLGIGEADDAEESGDENEPDDDEMGSSDDEPLFPNKRLQPARDALDEVHRRLHHLHDNSDDGQQKRRGAGR